MLQSITCRTGWAVVSGAMCLLATSAGQAAVGEGQPPASAPPIHANDLVGTWQGAFAGLEITRTPSGKLHGELHFFGPGERSGFTRNGNPISSISMDGRNVRLDLDEWSGELDSGLSADGQTLTTNFSWAPGQRFNLKRMTQKTARPVDPSPHKVLFVPVDKDVKLEVLDWGGEGPPLVLLAGHGNTAHVFDDFALKFTGKHHVYGITRRGWGMSSKPEPNDRNYDSDRMGNDVLAVIDALKLDRPVLAGHSLAGEELSSIGTRHPEKVSGLIYLDANYAYAFYGPPSVNIGPDLAALRRDALQLPAATPSQIRTLIKDMQTTMPRLQGELEQLSQQEEGVSDPSSFSTRLRERIDQYLFTSGRRYSAIKGPVLAIVATPKPCGQDCDSPTVKAEADSEAAQADAFAAGTPQARVVRIANADHYVFFSNEAQVIKEMNTFMDGLR